MSVFAGQAKGIISAFEQYEQSYMQPNNIKWREVRLTSLDEDGNPMEELWIPSSFNYASGALPSRIWDEEWIDRPSDMKPFIHLLWREKLFKHIMNHSEKMFYAIETVQSFGADCPSVFSKYVSLHATEIAENMINEDDEKGLIEFLKLGLAAGDSLKKIHEMCNENRFRTACAYALSLLNEQNKHLGKAASQICI